MKSKLKGFTLIELIIVIAIIAVLAGVLVPNMLSGIRKAKINSANATAKAVFNASQTIMQQYEVEFQNDSSVITGNTVFSDNTGAAIFTDSTKESISPFHSEFTDRFSRYYEDAERVQWRIYFDGFIVKAAVSAPTTTDIYVGIYPCIPGVTNTKGATLDYTLSNKHDIEDYDLSILSQIANYYS